MLRRILTRRRPAGGEPGETGYEDAVERAYRLILGRAADPDGAAGYLRALRTGELTLPQVCARLAESAEFAARLAPAPAPAAAADPDRVAVTELLRSNGVAELAERAEGYFATLDDPDALLPKPFANIAETPDLLVTFGQALRGLRPVPGMTVLDFGAGTCWTTRFLTQLGCRVIALDVSPSALDLGRRLFAELPVLGDRPEPEFLLFDGYRIDLPDAAVDRVLSFDALHHVPNPDTVLRELARVLRPGGIAAFAEPGEQHSAQPQSQYEMRNFGVLENDIVIEDVWATARDAGFAGLRLCLLDTDPAWVDLATFRDVTGGRAGPEVFAEPARAAIADRRMFWLRKEGTEAVDSRAADGLAAEISIPDAEFDGTVLSGTARIRNTGRRAWLPSDAGFGAVRLGVRAHLADDTTRDLEPVALPGDGVPPGAEVTVVLRRAVPPGTGAVRLDMVSQGVCWFSVHGSPVVTVPTR